MIKGYINRIIPFSSVDGPGNRTAIFLQGCNFNCLYCHNPETINTCVNCGECILTCPNEAISMESGKIKWEKEKCSQCDECLKTCKYNSTPKVTTMTVDEIINTIEKVKDFISGITVSGGECTLQTPFLIELFKKTKELKLSNFVDTNGSIPLWENNELVQLTDMFMLDVKSFETKEHKMLTGKSNSVVIENLKYLNSVNKLYEVRTVIVPETLDNYYNVNEISRLISTLNNNIIYKLMKYRPMGVRTNLLKSSSPSDNMMNELFNLAKNNGCKKVITI
ncbi:YjjW family glycine radical enzyme activase [Clostridium grantii]|nr:YjjW family glycine radical enzyme activase [Clostridium grantii]